tara:strand:- start:404 stop:769 length:366 start_codon:yes stop_codon:yes gene_type:complete
MEEDLEKISDELVKASGMHKSQADRIDKLLERKDNKSIAKVIKKLKNSNCGSPSKALEFQPKNLNQHLNQPMPNIDTGSEQDDKEEKEKKNPLIKPEATEKEKNIKVLQETKKTVLKNLNT